MGVYVLMTLALDSNTLILERIRIVWTVCMGDYVLVTLALDSDILTSEFGLTGL